MEKTIVYLSKFKFESENVSKMLGTWGRVLNSRAGVRRAREAIKIIMGCKSPFPSFVVQIWSVSGEYRLDQV